MKKLSKQQSMEKAQHVADLDTAKTEVEAAVEAYNDAIDDAYAKVDAAIGRYNEVVGVFNEWREQIQSEMQGYADERSDKWRDSEAGSSYQEWSDNWSEELPELDQNEPDKLDVSAEGGDVIDSTYADEPG